ncbi:hypothetical protein S83_019407, partial [Arachis hypogaea]
IGVYSGPDMEDATSVYHDHTNQNPLPLPQPLKTILAPAPKYFLALFSNVSCPYLEIYDECSSITGYFMKDVLLYGQVSGDLKMASANGSVIFGCGASQFGDPKSSNEKGLAGIPGFEKANSSFISRLASSGKVKNMFAHYLNGVNGDCIFAIGHVVQPKVNVTRLLPD